MILLFKQYFRILVYDSSMLPKSLLWNSMSHQWGQQKTLDPAQVVLPRCPGVVAVAAALWGGRTRELSL